MYMISLKKQELEQGLLTMIKDIKDKYFKEKDIKKLDNFCEECKKNDKTVSQNLILTGFKICESCRTSKTVFPV